MNTLTPLHDELDLALEAILDRIDTQAREAQWRLEDMYWEKDHWLNVPHIIEPSVHSWQEQIKLWEKYQGERGGSFWPRMVLPSSPHRHKGGAINLALIDETPPLRMSDLLAGHAFDRVLGNEPWLFEFTPPKIPWWKRNALYRAFKRRRYARLWGPSKAFVFWPRRNGKANR